MVQVVGVGRPFQRAALQSGKMMGPFEPAMGQISRVLLEPRRHRDAQMQVGRVGSTVPLSTSSLQAPPAPGCRCLGTGTSLCPCWWCWAECGRGAERGKRVELLAPSWPVPCRLPWIARLRHGMESQP